MGTDIDRKIARRLGRSLSAVTGKRTALGIPAAGRPDAWRPEELALLGAALDAEIAASLGRTVNAVLLKRSRLGIPAAPAAK